MKKLAQLLLYPLIALIVILIVRESVAQEAGRVPLVTIRFNQANVYYEQPLYQAISKAVAVKPGVMFDLVSLAPSTGNPANDGQWQQAASRHTQQVVASLQNMGVPLSRISVSGQAQSGLTADEVQVFVR